MKSWDEFSLKEYSKRYLEDRTSEVSFERILDFIRKTQVLKSVRKYAPRKILEIGPGPDPVFQYLESDEYDIYTIIEPNEDFIQIIKNLAKSSTIFDKIRIYQDCFDNAIKKLKEDNFDFIILSSVLHEVQDIDIFLQALSTICRKNTVVHINVPNAYSFHRLLAYEMGIIKSVFDLSETDMKFNRQRVFSKNKLIKVLENNGFKIISIWTYFIKLFSNKQMEKLIHNNIVDNTIIEGLTKMSKYLPEFGAEIFVEVRLK